MGYSQSLLMILSGGFQVFFPSFPSRCSLYLPTFTARAVASLPQAVVGLGPAQVVPSISMRGPLTTCPTWLSFSKVHTWKVGDKHSSSGIVLLSNCLFQSGTASCWLEHPSLCCDSPLGKTRNLAPIYLVPVL